MSLDSASAGPAAAFSHDHPPVRDPLAAHEARRALGERVADSVATMVGSWPFIIVQSTILGGWIVANLWLALHPERLHAWDPYPFILLTLMLSFQAAYTGPVVMMSQNRQANTDRLVAQNDYEINQKAEQELKIVMDHLVHQDRLLVGLMERLERLDTSARHDQIQEQLQALADSDQRILAQLGQAT
jgi:uncharacterized membrane protein